MEEGSDNCRGLLLKLFTPEILVSIDRTKEREREKERVA